MFFCKKLKKFFLWSPLFKFGTTGLVRIDLSFVRKKCTSFVRKKVYVLCEKKVYVLCEGRGKLFSVDNRGLCRKGVPPGGFFLE